MHSLNRSLKSSRKGRASVLLLAGAAALGLTHRVHAQAATTGGGSLVSPVTGTLASPPTSPLVPGSSGPSYGLGGPNMVLVKNWDFGTSGSVKNYDDMSREFFYHDRAGNIANGTYGAASAAPDFQDSVNDADVGKQPTEGTDTINGSSYQLPALRTFGTDSLTTYLTPTYNAAPTDMLSPYSHNAVASGSFTAKWKLPNGGQLLGQDIVWETKVRYVTPPNFWFSLWAVGSNWMHGAEADLIESYGEDYKTENRDITYGDDNFDGHLWHSNMVPDHTDNVEYLYNGFWGGALKGLGYDASIYDVGTNAYNPYKAADYHIWTWVYHADNSYQMFVDGREVQHGANYPWTPSAAPAVATPIDQRHQVGAPSDLEFEFDSTWGNTGIPGQTDFSVAASVFPGTYYQYKYSRVYLSGGTVNGVPVAEGAFTGNVTAPGTPPSVPCTIASSDYDTGGEGSGYHIYSDPSPIGTGYRADNNQHVYAAGSPGGNGEVLGWNIPNEWYKYTVTLPKPAYDTAAVLTASFEVNSYNSGGGTFHLEDESGNDLSGKMTVPSTNAPNPWVVITSQPFSLNAAVNPATGASGTHTLRLVMDTNGPGGFVADLSWMHLDYASTLSVNNTANDFANNNFATPVLFNNSDGYSSGPSNVYDVESAYIYNPTGNGWPMGCWNFNGNAGIAGTTDDVFGAPLLHLWPTPPAGSPQYQHQYAFLQTPIALNLGGGVINGVAGGAPGSMSQTLYLAPGTYTISFEAAQDYVNGGGSDVPVQVALDGGSTSPGGQNLGASIVPAVNSWGPSGGAPTIYSAPSFTVGSGGVPAGVHTITLASTSYLAQSWYETFIANVKLNFVPAPVGSTLITGTVFSDGAGPWHGLTTNAAPAAFDGSVSTFYDCANASGFVGVDAGTAQAVTKIVYAPRAGYESRMAGGVFEGSNTSATAGYTALATVTGTPKAGLTNTLPVSGAGSYRWLRYRGGGNCNVAEIQFLH